MKRKSILLMAFLMVLYIGPFLFAPSYSSPAIPTQQNIDKDFVLSTSWYNEDWDYRKKINITGDSETKTYWHMQFTVTYDSDMDSDFDDVRFTKSNGVTLLDYWIESYVADTSALVWLEVLDAINGSLTIYMYYGNEAASAASSGPNTFIFYGDWTDETIETDIKWVKSQEAGSVSWDDTDATHGSVIKIEGNAGSNKYAINSKPYTWMVEEFNGYSSDFSLRMRTNAESTSVSSQITQIGFVDVWDGGSAQALLKSYQGADNFKVQDDDANDDTQVISGDNFDTYSIFDINRNGTHVTLSRGGALQTTASMDPDENECAINLYCRDSEYDLYNDWLFVYKWVEGVGASFGAEQEMPNETWNIVGNATLIFNVPVDLWAWDMFLILLGLCMIPASTVYLVYGGRNNFSTDKLFYGLIVLLMGVGLIIGGIM